MAEHIHCTWLYQVSFTCIRFYLRTVQRISSIICILWICTESYFSNLHFGLHSSNTTLNLRERSFFFLTSSRSADHVVKYKLHMSLTSTNFIWNILWSTDCLTKYKETYFLNPLDDNLNFDQLEDNFSIFLYYYFRFMLFAFPFSRQFSFCCLSWTFLSVACFLFFLHYINDLSRYCMINECTGLHGVQNGHKWIIHVRDWRKVQSSWSWVQNSPSIPTKRSQLWVVALKLNFISPDSLGWTLEPHKCPWLTKLHVTILTSVLRNESMCSIYESLNIRLQCYIPVWTTWTIVAQTVKWLDMGFINYLRFSLGMRVFSLLRHVQFASRSDLNYYPLSTCTIPVYLCCFTVLSTYYSYICFLGFRDAVSSADIIQRWMKWTICSSR